MIILAIDTSCDDTSASVLKDTSILSNVVSSQTDLHKKWGGVVPDIAKRAHQERIKPVIAEAVRRSRISVVRSASWRGESLEKIESKEQKTEERIEDIIKQGMEKIDVIAVTTGPGLSPALGVGVNTAKELAIKYNKKLVEVNHIEGHLLSNLAKNREGKPDRSIDFPTLALTVSGGHTMIVLITQNDKISNSNSQFSKENEVKNAIFFKYEVIGETLDDAAGEALDKAAKLLGLGYPGGPVIERIAESGDNNYLKLPKPLNNHNNLDFSFSGLKTAFYYQVKDMDQKVIDDNLANLAASFQRAVFDSLVSKFGWAIDRYQPKTLLASGGVLANDELRSKLKKLAKEKGLKIYFPFKKILNTDNAGMIGVAGYYKALRGEFTQDIEKVDREPRKRL